MCNVEFRPWAKIVRGNPFMATITEKINGTNACIVIKEGEIVAVQSRKRFITPESDNFGFARWVKENEVELLSLEDGYHYGEWAGEGIQKNPLKLAGKHFFLFNTFRWNPDNPNKPDCCDVVPVLFNGKMNSSTVEGLLLKMIDDDTVEHEGVVVYYHNTRNYTKHTIKTPNGKWQKELTK